MYDVELVKNIPQSLAAFQQWLCFKLVDRGGARKGKPPVSPATGEVCAKNDESNYTTLMDALTGCETYDLDGVGFVFTNGFMAIDLDDCFDDDGSLTDVAQDIYDHFTKTYIEYSPSGNGLHIFVRGVKPNDRTKDSSLGVEVYSGYNFVTVTGDHIEGTGYDVVELQSEIDWLFDKYLPDTTVLQKSEIIVDHGDKTPREWLNIGLSKDQKLSELYHCVEHNGDESGADMALIMKLAYWLNRDVDAITDAFKNSPWVNSKDEYHKKKCERKDYLPESIGKAVQTVSETAANADKQFKSRADSFLALHTGADGDVKIELDSYTDYANAKVMNEIYGDILRYTKSWGWMYYNGTVWETDVDWRAVTCAINVGESLLRSAEAWIAADTERLSVIGIDPTSVEGKKVLAAATALQKHALYTQSAKGINAMVSIAKTLMIDDADTFDANPWLLNTPEFVVDLSTGERLPHSSRHKCTCCTSISPSLDGGNGETSEMFGKFLNQIFCGDEELIDYFQLQVGAAFVGKVYNENLIIANGSGSNGKSTVFGVLQSLLGDYATAIDPELLMSGRVSEQQVGMAMLQGKRLAIAQETEAGQQIRTSMLKRLVSTDTMVAKRLYHDPMNFTPTHTLILSTNHLPTISANDAGTWRRIVVLPFNATIRPEDMIADFQNVLMRNEGQQILDWCIRGAIRFFDMNCILSDKPKAVVDASNEYRESEDWLSAFKQDCLIEGKCVWHKELYKVYTYWARNANERVLSSNSFSRALASAGWKYEPKRYNKITQKCAKAWLGYELKAGVETSAGLRLVS